MICDKYNYFIYDVENEENFRKEFKLFFPGNDDSSFLNSEYFSLINLNEENEILFSYISRVNLLLSIVKFQSNYFSSYEIQNSFTSTSEQFEIKRGLVNSKCFITENKIIECLYLNSDKKLAIALFNQTLTYLSSIILDEDVVEYRYGYYFNNPINMIHLKNEIGIFAYYINDYYQRSFMPIRIQINELILDKNE